MKRLVMLIALCLSLFASSTILDVEQRGCCSHHGGVAGCSNGRIVCNDGSYSIAEYLKNEELPDKIEVIEAKEVENPF